MGVFLLYYIIIIGVIFILSFLVIPKTGREIRRFMNVIPLYFERASEFVDKLYMKYYTNMDNMPPIFQGIEEIILKKY